MLQHDAVPSVILSPVRLPSVLVAAVNGSLVSLEEIVRMQCVQDVACSRQHTALCYMYVDE
jgi:hypothetical protein